MGDWQNYSAPRANPFLTPVRRKAFVSFYGANRIEEVDEFVRIWSLQHQVFIAKAVGLTYGNDLINSDDADYVMRRLRADYLADSTVTILLLGPCTHSRRYVDWELKASLRQGDVYVPNGLLGILLPSAGGRPYLPPRFAANWSSGDAACYARYRPWPAGADQLWSWIEDAYNARTTRNLLIQNSADMMRYNATCRVCGITHPA